MLGLLFLFASFPLLPIFAAPQQNHHLHSLPGFSVWQQHIQAVRQAEARLGERASVGLGTSSSSDIVGNGVAEAVDTREDLRKVIKSVVENNLESLESQDEEAEELQRERLQPAAAGALVQPDVGLALHARLAQQEHQRHPGTVNNTIRM